MQLLAGGFPTCLVQSLLGVGVCVCVHTHVHVPACMCMCALAVVRGVCNFLGSVSPQQTFEAMEGPVLQMFYLARKENTSSRPQGGPTQKMLRGEARGSILAPLFLCFFSSP